MAESLCFSLDMGRFGNHIIFWLSYVFFKTYLNVSAGSSALLPESSPDAARYALLFGAQLTFLIVKVPLVYSCFYATDRYLEHRWNRWMLIGLLVLLLSVSAVAMAILNHFFVLPVLFSYHKASGEFIEMDSLIYHFFTLVFVVGVASSLRLLKKQYQSSLRESELKREKTETELKYLKNQINPHFLFNTLNNIYSLARKQSDQTADAVMKLSKLMRFMLYESNSPRIRLIEELKLIEDYIELEKLRYADRLTVEFKTQLDKPDQPIAPLLLIHFVENAFKHGAGESRFESLIVIDVKLEKGLLTVKIINTKENVLESGNQKPIGLENVKRQLQLLYPRHKLSLVNDKTHFSVQLSIHLKD
jgi:sensor histidine kinase YesM